MTDIPVLHIGDGSPEQIAFRLLMIIGQSEGKSLDASGYAKPDVTRKWLLDTYAECLDATRGSRIFAMDTR